MPQSQSRPLPVLAIVSLLFAGAGLLSFLDPAVISVAAVAWLLSVAALRSIRRRELSGPRCALGALVLASVSLLGSPVWWYAAYSAESTPNARRLDFAEVTRLNANLEPFDGQEVCLKGYAFPDGQMTVTQFVFTVDRDKKKLKTMVLVRLKLGEAWKFDERPLAVSGRVEMTRGAEDPAAMPRFSIVDAVVRPARTRFQLAPPARWNGC